jgi:competence protein ComEA
LHLLPLDSGIFVMRGPAWPVSAVPNGRFIDEHAPVTFRAGERAAVSNRVLMDINKATAEELEKAFQVDGTRAGYLIERRNKQGPFRTLDDVKQVPGFEDRMVENLRAAGLTLGSDRSEPNQRGGESSEGRGRSGELDINSASAEELERVFQMDGTRARYLIDTRNRIGGFRSWDDLKREAPSFDDGMIENLRKAGARLGPKAA